MTPKHPRSLFVCQSCGFQTGKWLGKCPDCEAWNSFLEEVLTGLQV
jgi:DNA repair protein RadA/Sms